MKARNLESIVETLRAWPEASYVSTLLGRWDVYVQLVCPDVEELWDLVTHRIRTLEGVLETETIMEMSVHKFTYKYLALGSFSDPAEPG